LPHIEFSIQRKRLKNLFGLEFIRNLSYSTIVLIFGAMSMTLIDEYNKEKVKEYISFIKLSVYIIIAVCIVMAYAR
jgi:hypothetical protein